MNLYAWINGNSYPISFGSGFDDELNETLDSGTIQLVHINGIINMKPYDDVWIYSGTLPTNRFQTLSAYNNRGTNFYHHYLIQNFNRDRVSLSDNYYNYQISLVSESKGLETCLMPNRTITNPKKIIEATQPASSTTGTQLGHGVGTHQVRYNLTTDRKEAAIIDSVVVVSGEGVTYLADRSYYNFVDKYFILTFNKTGTDPVNIVYTLTYHFNSNYRTLWDVISEYVESYSPKIRVEKLLTMTSSGVVAANNRATLRFNIGTNKNNFHVDKNILSWSYENGIYSCQIAGIRGRTITATLSYEVVNGGVWQWRTKYVLDNALKTSLHFDEIMAPETQFTTPTLRSALQQLFLVKDCLPIVKDNVITYLDIATRGLPIGSIPGASREQYTMDMESYSDRLRRTYSSALSQNNTCRFIEKIGFRNSEASTMTLDNMRLEFSHPIYKIKSVKMCLYNKYNVNDGVNKAMLSRYDITPLILQNSVRNLLSEDWNELKEAPGSFERMAKFKICTVGYNIGDKYITGWGEKYTYPVGWWSATKCYFENILDTVFKNNSLICGENILVEDTTTALITTPIGSIDNMISPASNPTWVETLDVSNLVSDFTQKIKTIFFEIEYDGFVDSAVQIVKDLHDGDICVNDNAATSLTIVEKDGLFEKEKANRLGNAVRVISARVDSISNILSLGRYISDTDEIIYKSSVNVEKDYFSVSYYLCKDYVLKNYYTSVWSKERPFSLASYGESISRNENKYVCLLLSKDKCYYQNTSAQISGIELNKLVSFFNNTNYDGLHTFNTNEINASTINNYLVDTQIFTVGNSLCFNVSMIDNITNGTYIKVLKPTFSSYFQTIVGHITGNTSSGFTTGYDGLDKSVGDLTGSVQDWYWISEDTETGFARNINFEAVSYSTEEINVYYKDKPNQTYNYSQSDFYTIDSLTGKVTSGIYKTLLDLPKQKTFTKNTSLNSSIAYKDGKERINMTMQIDAISDTNNVKISDKFLGMSDLNPNARKFNQPTTSESAFMLSKSFSLSHRDSQYSTHIFYENVYSIYIPENSTLSNLIGTNLNITHNLSGTQLYYRGTSYLLADITGTITFGNVISATDYEIIVSVTEVMNSSATTTSATRTYNAIFKVAPTKVEYVGYDSEDLDMQIEVPISANGYAKYSFSTNKALLPMWNDTTQEFETYSQTITPFTNTAQFYQTIVNQRNYSVIETNGNIRVVRDNINFSGYSSTKNIYWYICDLLPEYYVPEDVPNNAVEVTVSAHIITTGAPYLSISTINAIPSDKSIRCYIDGKFVFGMNSNGSNNNNVYLSLMDTRSKSVISPTTGDKVGEITNYVTNREKTYGTQNDYDS